MKALEILRLHEEQQIEPYPGFLTSLNKHEQVLRARKSSTAVQQSLDGFFWRQ